MRRPLAAFFASRAWEGCPCIYAGGAAKDGEVGNCEVVDKRHRAELDQPNAKWCFPKTEAPRPMRRGGRVVECGGLENRFTRNPGNEGSNPSSSAS